MGEQPVSIEGDREKEKPGSVYAVCQEKTPDYKHLQSFSILNPRSTFSLPFLSTLNAQRPFHFLLVSALKLGLSYKTRNKKVLLIIWFQFFVIICTQLNTCRRLVVKIHSFFTTLPKWFNNPRLSLYFHMYVIFLLLQRSLKDLIILSCVHTSHIRTCACTLLANDKPCSRPADPHQRGRWDNKMERFLRMER